MGFSPLQNWSELLEEQLDSWRRPRLHRCGWSPRAQPVFSICSCQRRPDRARGPVHSPAMRCRLGRWHLCRGEHRGPRASSSRGAQFVDGGLGDVLVPHHLDCHRRRHPGPSHPRPSHSDAFAGRGVRDGHAGQQGNSGPDLCRHAEPAPRPGFADHDCHPMASATRATATPITTRAAAPTTAATSTATNTPAAPFVTSTPTPPSTRAPSPTP